MSHEGSDRYSSPSTSRKYHVKNDLSRSGSQKSSHDHSLKMQQELVRETNCQRNGDILVHNRQTPNNFVFKFGSRKGAPCRLRDYTGGRVVQIRGKSRESSQQRLVVSASNSPAVSSNTNPFHKAFYNKVKSLSSQRKSKIPKAYRDSSCSSDSEIEEKKCSFHKRKLVESSFLPNNKRPKLDSDHRKRLQECSMVVNQPNSSSDESGGGDWLSGIIEDENSKEDRVKPSRVGNRHRAMFPVEKDNFVRQKPETYPNSPTKSRSKFVSKVKPKNKKQEAHSKKDVLKPSNLKSGMREKDRPAVLRSNDLTRKSVGEDSSPRKMNDQEFKKLVSQVITAHTNAGKSRIELRRNSEFDHKTSKSTESSLSHVDMPRKNNLARENKSPTKQMKPKVGSGNRSIKREFKEREDKQHNFGMIKSENSYDIHHPAVDKVGFKSESRDHYNENTKKQTDEVSKPAARHQPSAIGLKSSAKYCHKNADKPVCKVNGSVQLRASISPRKTCRPKTFVSKVKQRSSAKSASPHYRDRRNSSPAARRRGLPTNTFAEQPKTRITSDAGKESRRPQAARVRSFTEIKQERFGSGSRGRKAEESRRTSGKVILNKKAVKTEDPLVNKNNFFVKSLETAKKQSSAVDITFNKSIIESHKNSLSQKQIPDLEVSKTKKEVEVKQESNKPKENSKRKRRPRPRNRKRNSGRRPSSRRNARTIKKELKSPNKADEIDIPPETIYENLDLEQADEMPHADTAHVKEPGEITATVENLMVTQSSKLPDSAGTSNYSSAPFSLKSPPTSSVKSPPPSIQSFSSIKSPPTSLESVSSLKNTVPALKSSSSLKITSPSLESVSSLKNGAPTLENALSSLESAAKESLAICTAKVKVEMEDERPFNIYEREKTLVCIKEEPVSDYFDESKTVPSVKNHFANVKNGQHFYKKVTKLQNTFKSGRSPKVLSQLPKLKQRIERLPNFNPKKYEKFSKRLKNENKQPYQLLGEFFAQQNAGQVVRLVDRSQVLNTVDASKLIAKESSSKNPIQKAQLPKNPILSSNRVTRSQKVYDKTQSSAVANPTPTRSSLRIACKASLASTGKAPGKIIRVKRSDSKDTDSSSEETLQDINHSEKDDENKHDVTPPILTASESLPAKTDDDRVVEEEEVSEELISPTEGSKSVKTKDSLTEVKPDKTKSSLTEDKSVKSNVSLAVDKSVKTNISLAEDKSVNTKKALTEDKSVKINISLAEDKFVNTKKSFTEDKSVKTNILLAEDKSLKTNIMLAKDKSLKTNIMLAKDKSVKSKVSLAENSPLKTNIMLAEDKSVKSKVSLSEDKLLNTFVSSKSSVPEAVKMKYAVCSKSTESPTALCLTNKTSNSSLQSEKKPIAKAQKVFHELSPKEDRKKPEVTQFNFTNVKNNNDSTDTASETEVVVPSKTSSPEKPQNLQILKSPLKASPNLADSLARSPAAKIAKQLGMPVAKQLEQQCYSSSNVCSNEILHVTEKSSNETAGAVVEQAMNLKVYRNEKQRLFDDEASPKRKVKRGLFASDDEFLSKNAPSPSESNFHVSEEADKPQDLSLSNKNLPETSCKALKVPNIYKNLLENQLSLSYKNQPATKEDQGASNPETKNRKESGFCSDNFETSSTVSKSPDNLSSDAFVAAAEAQQQVGSKAADADLPNSMTNLDMLLLAVGHVEDKSSAAEVVAPKQRDSNVVSTLNDVSAADKRMQVPPVEQQKNTGSEECLNLSNQSSGSTDNSAANSVQPQQASMLATGGAPNTQQVFNQPPVQQMHFHTVQLQQVINGKVVTVPAFVPIIMPANGSQMQPVQMGQFPQIGPILSPNGTQMPALPMGQFPMAMMPGQLLQPQVAGQSFIGQNCVNMSSSEHLNSPPPVGQVPIGSPQPMHNVGSNIQQMNLNQSYPAVIQNQFAQSLFGNYQPEKSVIHNNTFNGTLNVSNNSDFQNLPANQSTQITNTADSTNNQAVRDGLFL